MKKKDLNKTNLKENKKAKKESKKTEKIENKEKEEKTNKFVETLKKKWLINGTKTFLLVVIIIGLFIGISLWMKDRKSVV